LVLDTQREITTQGHVVLAANMLYIGPRYPIARDVSFTDGLLDVLVFAELSKLDRDDNSAEARFQNGDDLGAAQRCRLYRRVRRQRRRGCAREICAI
jgi:hypothetical protein